MLLPSFRAFAPYLVLVYTIDPDSQFAWFAIRDSLHLPIGFNGGYTYVFKAVRRPKALGGRLIA